MAAKKKSGKKKKAAKKGAGAKKTTGPRGGAGGGRGRKAVLTGVTPDQGKRMRRALRAKGIRLSDLKAGETVAVKEKGGNLVCKVGKNEISIPVEAKARG